MRYAMFAAVLILATACSGSGSEAEDEPLVDDEEARSMLLTLDDFPSGWSEKASDDDDEPSPLDECEFAKRTDVTGRAETGDFSDGGLPEISQSLVIYKTEDAARDAIEPERDPVECFIDALKDGALDDDDVEITDASFSPLSFPDKGDSSTAYRIEIDIEQKGESGLGSQGTAYLDIVSVAINDVAFSIVVVDVFSPFDTDELEKYVDIAVTKLD